jgi:hypothetical protein
VEILYPSPATKGTAYEELYIPQLLNENNKPDGKHSKQKKQYAIAKNVYI